MKNRYNQLPHLTQDTNRKVINSQKDITKESQGVSPFPAGNHKAHTNRCVQGSWLPISFLIIFRTFSMELISGKFPGDFRTCMVTWMVQNTSKILSIILKYYVNALCSRRCDISRHAITLKILEHSKIVKDYWF